MVKESESVEAPIHPHFSGPDMIRNYFKIAWTAGTQVINLICKLFPTLHRVTASPTPWEKVCQATCSGFWR